MNLETQTSKHLSWRTEPIEPHSSSSLETQGQTLRRKTQCWRVLCVLSASSIHSSCLVGQNSLTPRQPCFCVVSLVFCPPSDPFPQALFFLGFCLQRKLRLLFWTPFCPSIFLKPCLCRGNALHRGFLLNAFFLKTPRKGVWNHGNRMLFAASQLSVFGKECSDHSSEKVGRKRQSGTISPKNPSWQSFLADLLFRGERARG